jgi:hypothetical protein
MKKKGFKKNVMKNIISQKLKEWYIQKPLMTFKQMIVYLFKIIISNKFHSKILRWQIKYIIWNYNKIIWYNNKY